MRGWCLCPSLIMSSSLYHPPTQLSFLHKWRQWRKVTWESEKNKFHVCNLTHMCSTHPHTHTSPVCDTLSSAWTWTWSRPHSFTLLSLRIWLTNRALKPALNPKAGPVVRTRPSDPHGVLTTSEAQLRPCRDGRHTGVYAGFWLSVSSICRLVMLLKVHFTQTVSLLPQQCAIKHQNQQLLFIFFKN